MRTLRRTAVSLLILSVALTTALPVTAQAAEGGCLKGFKAAFRKVTEPMRKIQEAVKDYRLRKARAQAMEIQEILGEKWKEAQAEARRANGGKDPADPQAAFDEFVKKWEDDVLERMAEKGKKNYPKLAELMALMAAKSPNFEMTLMEYLWNHGSVKYKVLAHFTELMKGTESGVAGKVSWGKHFWTLWQTKIKIPQRGMWNADQFAMFMTEMSNAMFRTMNPEPGFRMTWIKAFGEVRLDPKTWKVWEHFSNKLIETYRAKHKLLLEGVTKDIYGEPRPEMIRSFYRWGMWDTVFRHLTAVRTLFTKNGTKIIEWKTGLKIEEVDALFDTPISKYLPRAVKDALIAAKSPEIFREILYNAEVERLSLEVMFFTRPIISGLFLYYTLLEPAYGMYQESERRKDFEEEVKKNPEKYIDPTLGGKGNDDRIQNLTEQIDQLTIEKRDIEDELKQPSLSQDEKTMRTKTLDRINKKIGKLQELKIDLQRGVDTVHP